jgi:SAM-dependent methyltransferase
MRAGALAPYETALRHSAPLSLVAHDGRVLPLAIERYLAAADEVDATVIQRCEGPVLDVGCGPGRMVHALAAQGIPALGVDIADMAVALATGRGATALSRSVFERVPGEGRWPTILVLDGNIGIGGDVRGLLTRLAGLIAPGGRLLVESSSAASAGTDEVLSVRFGRDGAVVGPQFAWALVDRHALMAHAQSVGLVVTEDWSAAGRDFVRLVRRPIVRRPTLRRPIVR